MNHFQIFGLPPSVDLDVPALEAKHRQLSLELHPDRLGANADAAQRRKALEQTTALNDALKVLKDPFRRLEYLLEQRGVSLEKQQMPMEFLEQTIERREALDSAKADLSKVRQLAEGIERERDDALSKATAAFKTDDTATAATLLAQVKYFVRFLEEVDAIEDEALS